MKTFTEQFNEFEEKLNITISSTVKKYGNNSSILADEPTIDIVNEIYQYNLNNGEYLTEISPYKLISNNGNHYSYYTLTTELLCNLIDYIIESFKTK